MESKTKNNELHLHHHLGLGDHMDCNGLVRFFLATDDYNRINLFVKSTYYNMIKTMYSDESRINLVKIDVNEDEDQQVFEYVKKSGNTNLLRVGHENYPFGRELLDNKNCWEYFYEQVEIPYSAKVDYFHIDRDFKEEDRVFKKLNPSNKPYAFVHDDPSRGYNLNTGYLEDNSLKIIKNDPTENVFHFLTILERAEEIHCMESCFKSLIEIYAKTDKLFYHDFRGHPLGDRTNKQWKIIKYD